MHIRYETKVAPKLCLLCLLVENKLEITWNVWPVTFNFQDRIHRQITQIVKLSNMDAPLLQCVSQQASVYFKQSPVRRSTFSQTLLNILSSIVVRATKS
jgi:hypothetical protein